MKHIRNTTQLLAAWLAMSHSIMCFGRQFAPPSDAEAREQHAALSEWRQVIEETKELPSEDSIEKLGRCVVKMPKEQIFQVDERWDVYRDAQAALLSIPGHSEYYRDRINAERAKLDALRVNGNVTEIAHQRGKWESAKNGFNVMSQLPSLETVRVLGGFLADERGKIILPARPTHDEEMLALATRPHCYDAVVTLNRLPFVTMPFKTHGDIVMFEEYEPALASWRQWHEEIKSGRRTFRFEGDPTEYDLNGPAPKGKLERIARDRKRDAQRVAGHRKTAGPSGVSESKAPRDPSTSIPAAILIAAMVLLGSVAWYFMGRRRSGQ